MGDKMKKCVMIYNSKSGKKKSDQLLPELEHIINEKGYEFSSGIFVHNNKQEFLVLLRFLLELYR